MAMLPVHHDSVRIESEALLRSVAYPVAPSLFYYRQVEREDAQPSFPVVEDQCFGEERIDQDLRGSPSADISRKLGANLGRDVYLGRTSEQSLAFRQVLPCEEKPFDISSIARQ